MSMRDRYNNLPQDPTFTRVLFGDTRMAWLWLIVRLYVGWQWISAGLGKLSEPAWMNGGAALQGFWERAVTIPAPPARPPIAFEWYRAFIQGLLDGGHYVWFSKLVVFGEILVGAALILGLFTGLAAFFGGFMNWNYMMAGAASTNPVLLMLSVLLVLAWKIAGWWGLDRWVLNLVGTPWSPGQLVRRRKTPAAA